MLKWEATVNICFDKKLNNSRLLFVYRRCDILLIASTWENSAIKWRPIHGQMPYATFLLRVCLQLQKVAFIVASNWLSCFLFVWVPGKKKDCKHTVIKVKRHSNSNRRHIISRNIISTFYWSASSCFILFLNTLINANDCWTFWTHCNIIV